MALGNIDLSIVIPFYNEEGNIGLVYHAIAKSFQDVSINYEIIMVDNGSDDNTGKYIDKLLHFDSHVKKVSVEKNKGYGFGVISGVNAAKGRFVGYVDGDDPSCASYAVKLYFKAVESNLDICRGIRVIRGDRLNRKVASNLYNALFNLFFLNSLHDVNGKPKIINKLMFDALDITSNDWFIDSELLIKALNKNLKIASMPVIAQKRMAGFSYVKLKTALEFIKNMARYRWGLWTNQEL